MDKFILNKMVMYRRDALTENFWPDNNNRKVTHCDQQQYKEVMLNFAELNFPN